jgi:DMSO/TMAO reductase YedYZ molybdopterin-dependent catalytic subunit
MRARHISRREVLGALAMAGGATLVDPCPLLARMASDLPCAGAAPAGDLIATLPLFRERSQAQPFGMKFGNGLDARLITDLSLLEPGALITANELAYIRTEIPPAAAAHQGPWTIKGAGLVTNESTLTLADLTTRARAQGPHLIECSGNANPSNFGLMSVAEWDGVPFAEIVERLRPAKGATAVLVSGVDHEASPSGRSVPGASWLFPLASIEEMDAFLATRMNGQPLPPDHGAPVRIVIPGWYGCSWIKWVNEIRIVGPDEPATSQMIEFANRTHQTAQHALARDYAPAEIHTAATPVRVEKRRTPGGLEYRIVGILWGGARPVDRLAIRFNADDEWKPFAICPAPKTHTMWSLWEYRWRPTAPGLYNIALRVPDASVPQRRLDSGYYVRQVSVTET